MSAYWVRCKADETLERAAKDLATLAEAAPRDYRTAYRAAIKFLCLCAPRRSKHAKRSVRRSTSRNTDLAIEASFQWPVGGDSSGRKTLRINLPSVMLRRAVKAAIKQPPKKLRRKASAFMEVPGRCNTIGWDGDWCIERNKKLQRKRERRETGK